jgi:hypothetical protein
MIWQCAYINDEQCFPPPRPQIASLALLQHTQSNKANDEPVGNVIHIVRTTFSHSFFFPFCPSLCCVPHSIFPDSSITQLVTTPYIKRRGQGPSLDSPQCKSGSFYKKAKNTETLSDPFALLLYQLVPEIGFIRENRMGNKTRAKLPTGVCVLRYR